jgi:hypothetical protein
MSNLDTNADLLPPFNLSPRDVSGRSAWIDIAALVIDARMEEVRDEVKRKLLDIDCTVRTFFDPRQSFQGVVLVLVEGVCAAGFHGEPVRVVGRVALWDNAQKMAQEMQRETDKVALVFAKRLQALR